MKHRVEKNPQIPQLSLNEIDSNALQSYLRSSCPPSIGSFKRYFYRTWHRKIRSRCKQKANRYHHRNCNNIYAIAHRQLQEKCDNYLPTNTFLTFGDLKRNEKLLFNNNNNNYNIMNNILSKDLFKKTITEYSCSRIKKVSDNIYHTFHPKDKISVSVILRNFFFECPICLGSKNINGSYIHDCGHLMCHDCVVSMIDCFPNTSLLNLFNKCHICRNNNEI